VEDEEARQTIQRKNKIKMRYDKMIRKNENDELELK
jgi:hypothetical protein